MEKQNEKFVIGLVGTIGAGKSTVLSILRALGAAVIDADKVGHQVMEPGTEGFNQILALYGSKVIDANGKIDRKALAQIVFADEKSLDQLEQILHPLIDSEIKRFIQQSPSKVVVIEAIKLLESSIGKPWNSIWLVRSDLATQIERLRRDRNMDTQQIEARMNSQASETWLANRADVIIDNSGTREATRMQVVKAWDDLGLSKS